MPDKRHSAKLALPSLFLASVVPSVTLGEPFAECFMSFAECFGHSANSKSPVVLVTSSKVMLLIEFVELANNNLTRSMSSSAPLKPVISTSSSDSKEIDR